MGKAVLKKRIVDSTVEMVADDDSEYEKIKNKTDAELFKLMREAMIE